jgi:nitronate monooxygenase
MLVQVRGLQKLEQAIKPGNYENLWCAGQTVELINEIKSCDVLIADLINELNEAKKNLDKMFT